MIEEYRTERMLFRPLRADDRDRYVRYHETSREHFRPWFPTVDAHQTPAERFAADLERSRAEHDSGGGARRIGVLDDGRMAGAFNLSQIFRRDFLSCYAGWHVAADCVGRGLATEGVLALLDLAFAPEPIGLGLHRVQANIIPRNVASLRVAEKAGFRPEGRALRYLRIAGSWEDHLMFAKTSEEHALQYLAR